MTDTAARAIDYETSNCVIARSLDVFGDRASFLVLREVFNGVRRFDDMQLRTRLPRQVLTDRLARLVNTGLLRREAYREPGQRARSEYRLTDKGLDLYPLLVALLDWGNRYILTDDEEPSVEFVHRDCGAEVHLVMRCDDGHELASPRRAVPRPGPGAILRH